MSSYISLTKKLLITVHIVLWINLVNFFTLRFYAFEDTFFVYGSSKHVAVYLLISLLMSVLFIKLRWDKGYQKVIKKGALELFFIFSLFVFSLVSIDLFFQGVIQNSYSFLFPIAFSYCFYLIFLMNQPAEHSNYFILTVFYIVAIVCLLQLFSLFCFLIPGGHICATELYQKGTWFELIGSILGGTRLDGYGLNQYAYMAVLGLWMMISIFPKLGITINKFFKISTQIVFILLLIVTQSRGSLIIITGFFFISFIIDGQFKKTVLFLMAVIVSVLILNLMNSDNHYLPHILSFNGMDESINERLFRLSKVYNEVNLLNGSVGGGALTNSHTYLIDILANYGLFSFGLLCYFIFLLFNIKSLFRDNVLKYQGIFMFCVVLLLDDKFYWWLMLIPAVISIAIKTNSNTNRGYNS